MGEELLYAVTVQDVTPSRTGSFLLFFVMLRRFSPAAGYWLSCELLATLATNSQLPTLMFKVSEWKGTIFGLSACLWRASYLFHYIRWLA